MNKSLLYLEKKLAALLLRFLDFTIQYEVHNQNPGNQKCIYMFWHRNLLLLTLQRMGDPVAVLISPSKDGELIAGPVGELGYYCVRGSSSKKGSTALRKMIEIASEYQLAITPDGPKGPPKSIHPGVMQIAYFGKVPIIPVAATVNKDWVFNSWDKFRVPKPFSKIRIRYGYPIWVSSKEDFAEVETELKRVMDELEQALEKT